jgi:hypothetical protein
MKERRECKRTETDSKVKCYAGLSTVESSETGKSLAGSTVDISERGICLVVNKPLKEHEVFKIILPLKDIDVKIPVLAMVRWVEPYQRKYKAGLMFIA